MSAATVTQTRDLWTTRKVIEWTTEFFAEAEIDSPRLTAELLLAEVLDLTRVGIYLDYYRPLSATERSGFRELVRRRAAGEPVQYLVGRQSFRYLDLRTRTGVLIPRPETETVVDHALNVIRDHRWPDPHNGKRGPRVADVGTGTGAIALSIAKEAGQYISEMTAIDSSEDALELARENMIENRLEDLVQIKRGDLLSGWGERSLDLIVSNPPYIPSAEIELLAREVRDYEPRLALDGGEDGLSVLRALCDQAGSVLSDHGALVLEIGETQAADTRAIFTEANWGDVKVHQDLAGRDRAIVAMKE